MFRHFTGTAVCVVAPKRWAFLHLTQYAVMIDRAAQRDGSWESDVRFVNW